MTNKRILLVCRKAPYGNSLSREALDIALATSVFDQQLAIAFIGDGVWQLLSGQNSQPISAKNHAKISSAFPLYDIKDIYVDTESMQQRNIAANDLCVDVIVSSKSSLAKVMEQADVIFNF